MEETAKGIEEKNHRLVVNSVQHESNGMQQHSGSGGARRIISIPETRVNTSIAVSKAELFNTYGFPSVGP